MLNGYGLQHCLVLQYQVYGGTGCLVHLQPQNLLRILLVT